ncbi:MAG: endonuclease NucS [Candidatus Bathyarchaeota archaeon]|nr:MAG: endonuclease NucS [Candidatus Bathyarchaeota archaeon]
MASYLPDNEHVLVLENPENHEAERALKDAISQRKMIILVGECRVGYKGRASSELESGERIVILKEDGSVLVHRPRGYEAVNWQPPGCIFYVNVEKRELTVSAMRRKPVESIHVYFDSIYILAIMRLRDHGRFSLHASEEDMQKAILLKPSIIEEGLVPVDFEKKVEPGFVDVYGIDRQNRFVVVEIKRKPAGRTAVLQLSKYVKAVQKTVNRDVRGVLVAPTLAKGAQRMLFTLGLSFKSLDPKKCAQILQKPQTCELTKFFRQDR